MPPRRLLATDRSVLFPVYLKMLPHKWSYVVEKSVRGAMEASKKAEASECVTSEASLPKSVIIESRKKGTGMSIYSKECKEEAIRPSDRIRTKKGCSAAGNSVLHPHRLAKPRQTQAERNGSAQRGSAFHRESRACAGKCRAAGGK